MSQENINYDNNNNNNSNNNNNKHDNNSNTIVPTEVMKKFSANCLQFFLD